MKFLALLFGLLFASSAAAQSPETVNMMPFCDISQIGSGCFGGDGPREALIDNTTDCVSTAAGQRTVCIQQPEGTASPLGSGAGLQALTITTDRAITQSDVDNYDIIVYDYDLPLTDKDMDLPAPTGGKGKRLVVVNDAAYVSDANFGGRSFTVESFRRTIFPGHFLETLYTGTMWQLLNAVENDDKHQYGCWPYGEIFDCKVNKTINSTDNTFFKLAEFPKGDGFYGRRTARKHFVFEQQSDGSHPISVWCSRFTADSLTFRAILRHFIRFATAETTEVGAVYLARFDEAGEDFSDGRVDNTINQFYTTWGNRIRSNSQAYNTATTEAVLDITLEDTECLAALGYLTVGTSIAVQAEEIRLDVSFPEKF